MFSTVIAAIWLTMIGNKLYSIVPSILAVSSWVVQAFWLDFSVCLSAVGHLESYLYTSLLPFLTLLCCSYQNIPKIYEPCHAKTCLRVFLRPCKTQTGLLSYRNLLESWNFGFNKNRYYNYLGSEQQRHWSDCVDAQADLHLCCSHMV